MYPLSGTASPGKERMMTTTIERETERMSDRLHTWWDRVKVQAQLAQMDAEDAWRDVERYAERTLREVDRAAQQVRGAKDQADLQLQLGLMEAQERAEHLEGHLEALWHRLRAEGQDAEGKVELAGLRAHLAKMDAEDYIASKRDELRRRIEHSKADAESMLTYGMMRVSARIDRMLHRDRQG